MPKADKRRLLLLMREVSNILTEEMAGHGDGKYARGLSNEGFAGGYQQALYDIEAVLTHGYPGDERGYWSRAAKRLKASQS